MRWFGGWEGGRRWCVVSSLSTPEPRAALSLDATRNYDPVRLFVARASTASPHFALTGENASAVAEVCWRLDGIPLALELAAARLRMLPVEQLAARLDDAFRLLTGGSRTALPRHQMLQALIDTHLAVVQVLELRAAATGRAEVAAPAGRLCRRLDPGSGGGRLCRGRARGGGAAPGHRRARAPASHATRERLMAQTREQLGEVSFAAQWSAGAAVSAAEAIERALRTEPDV